MRHPNRRFGVIQDLPVGDLRDEGRDWQQPNASERNEDPFLTPSASPDGIAPCLLPAPIRIKKIAASFLETLWIWISHNWLLDFDKFDSFVAGTFDHDGAHIANLRWTFDKSDAFVP